jgi:hypothetical protein
MEAHTARARQDDTDHQAVLRDHLIKLGVFSIGGGLVLVFVAVLSIVQSFPGGAFLVLTVPLGIVGVLMVVRGFLQILRATVWRGRMTEKTLSRWAR